MIKQIAGTKLIISEDCSTIPESLSANNPSSINHQDMRDIFLRRQNMKDLEALQRIILVEEDQVLSTDEVLARVLKFYGRFVPFRNP